MNIAEAKQQIKNAMTAYFTKDKFGNYNFTPVSILASDKGVTVVEKNYYYDDEGKTVATVKNYDEILKGE